MHTARLFLIILIFFSNHAYAVSKCQYEWNALKKVQELLRKQSTQRLRDLEHKKHNTYQNCRKGKNKTYNKKKNKLNLENIYSGKKQKAWLKYYRTPQYCKNPSTEKKREACIKQRNDKAYHFERVWSSKQR